MAKKKTVKKKTAKKTVKKKTTKNKTFRVGTSNVSKKSYKPSKAVAVTSLIVNIIFPGIGSLIANKMREGVWQIVLMIVALFLYGSMSFKMVGYPIHFIAFIWGIMTSVKVLNNSR